MHPKNRYAGPHDFAALARREPRLAEHLTVTPDGRNSLDFTSPRAVYLLNRTLLLRDYGLRHWDIPDEQLTPPVPGRLDYVHTLADLLAGHAGAVRVLDIGTGASLIYPILGVGEYGWQFVGTDVDERSLRVAAAIVKFNPPLRGRVVLRHQQRPGSLFAGVVGQGEEFTCSMCNPPFFASREAAEAAARKKWEKLGVKDRHLSFGGSDSELWTPGGEPAFLVRMIRESGEFRRQFGWFTTLVSKRGYLEAARSELGRVGATDVRVLDLRQGNKAGRILAWRFVS